MIRESDVEHLLQLRCRIIWIYNSVSNCSRVSEDLVVVASLGSLVTEEVDGGVLDAISLLCLCLKVTKAIGLIPTCREDVEGELASNGETVYESYELEPINSLHDSTRGDSQKTHVNPR